MASQESQWSMTTEEELSVCLDVSECTEVDADAYIAALKRSRKQRKLRKLDVISVCTSDEQSSEEEQPQCKRVRLPPLSCVPVSLHEWCGARGINVFAIKPTTEGMACVFEQARNTSSKFLMTACKLSLLMLKTLPVVADMARRHSTGELVAPEGRTFVPEHAAARHLWRNLQSVLTFGSAGAGKTTAAVDMLAEEAAPQETTVVGNTWLQVGVLLEKLSQRSAPPVLLQNTGTRAARYNTGRLDVLPDARLVSRNMTNASLQTLVRGSKVWNDELPQWRPGMAAFVDQLARVVRKDERPFGGLQFGGGGGVEQLMPILSKAEYKEAKERQALPRQEAMLEDDALLDKPDMHVLLYTKVMRQGDERFSNALNEYGAGIVSDDGWQVAQELMASQLTDAASHLWPFNSQAREMHCQTARALARNQGRDFREHVCPVGARLKEEELRAVEEQYILHKLVVVVGEPMLLVVTELRTFFAFADGMRAYNNMTVVPVGFTKDALDEEKVIVECPSRPPGAPNRLVLPMVERQVMVPRLGGEQRVRNWPLKSKKHRTAASGQGQGMHEVNIHGENMTHPGVLYMSISRGEAIERTRLNMMSRAELKKKLKPHPKALIFLAALGRKVITEDVHEAIRTVIDSEAKWA